MISHAVQRSAGLANASTLLTQTSCCQDPAKRLSLASETSGWAQTYNYDAFGNRAVAAGSYMPNEGFTPSGTVASVFPASNNRLVRGAGDSYDGAGNQTAWATVPPSASGSWFTYDGENRLLTANVANQGGASFVYDGEGRRVQKISSSGAVTTYVHDAMGNLAAEYSTAAPAAAGTQYLTSDFLGSTRLITDASGNPVRCFDYLPFGEEIPAGMNGRSGCYETMGSPQYPSPPDVADQKFTGKERDAETGLDYFGARYFSAAQGRFTSPDWSAKPQPIPYADLGDPQTLNLYAYVRNNPLSVADLDGHGGCDGAPGLCAAIRDAVSNGGSIDDGRAAHDQAQQQSQKEKAQQQTPYQAGNREANVVYHETSALQPVNGKSDSGDLHDARVGAAHVYNNLNDKSKFQDTGTLNSGEQKALAGGYGPAVRAYNDSVSAVSEAASGADTTNGSKHFFVRDVTAGDAQHVPSWANGNQIVYGPFRTTAGGDGPIHQGDTVYIWINNTR